MGDSRCNYEYINSIAKITEKCQVLANDCEFNYFSLIKVNFCYFNDQKVATILIAILIIGFCFYFVANTADKYLAPVLGTMSEKLNLSQNLAGLTLLALGNQAPDVVVAIISGGDENEGITISLGAVLGSSLMILHIVLSTVVLLGNDFNVVPANYIRDFSVFLFSLVIIVLFGFLKEIALWQSICFFCLYIAYVGLCIFMDRKLDDTQIEQDTDDLIKDDVTQDYDIKLFKDEVAVVTQKEINIKDEVQQNYFYKRIDWTAVRKRSRLYSKTTLFKKFKYGLIKSYIQWSETSWEEKNLFQKSIYVAIEFFLNFVRNITIPPFEKSKWNRSMFIAMPLTVPLFLIGVFRIEYLFTKHWPYMIGFFALMGGLSVLISRTTYRNQLPKYEWVLLIAGCIITLCWLWGMVNILLDMVCVVKMLLPIKIPQAFFTMTLVSLGNALPDFFNNCSLAKTGYAEMAYSGSIGSPVFGTLVGFGISLIKTNISQSKIPFDIFNLTVSTNKIIITALSCLGLNLIRLLCEGFILQFKMKRFSAFIGYSLYACFLVCICYFTFGETQNE